MRIYITLACILSILGSSTAQEFITLHDYEQNVVNGTLLIKTGSADEFSMDIGVHATLISGADRNINVRRYELDVQTATMNYFCWGICYGPVEAGAMPVWYAQSNHSLNLSAGVPVTNFHAYHVPQGVVGTSTYRYVWYDTASPNDTVWVDISFQSLPVGIEELSRITLDIYPNPSVGENINFSMENAGVTDGTRLVVYNALGGKVHSSVVRNGEQMVVLSTSALSPGIYFANIEQAGAASMTRRFVVSDR